MADSPLDPNTRLAAERNRLALERTMMAWTRTAVSLIAFGFTVYQIFSYLSAKEALHEPRLTPHVFGATMIVIGLISLTLAWIQHLQELRSLRKEFGPMPYSIAGVVAGFVAGLGVIALVGVTLRF